MANVRTTLYFVTMGIDATESWYRGALAYATLNPMGSYPSYYPCYHDDTEQWQLWTVEIDTPENSNEHKMIKDIINNEIGDMYRACRILDQIVSDKDYDVKQEWTYDYTPA